MSAQKPKPRCEGYRRYGGAFTLGPVRWEQCNEEGIVVLHIAGCEPTPACSKCWKEAIENKLPIESADPL